MITAGITQSITSSLTTGMVGNRASLLDVNGTCVFDLDYTIAESYPGTGTALSNYIADSSYNQTINGSPTFTGDAGSPSAYMNQNNSSYSVLTGTNTDIINNLHKTTGGQDFTMLYAFRHIAAAIAQGLQATRLTGTNIGVQMYTFSDNKVYLTQRGDTAAVTPALGGAALANATDYLIMVSHSHANNRTRLWQNSATALEVAHTFNATTSSAGAKLAISALANGSSTVENNHRTYCAALFTEEFDDTKAQQVIDVLNARHGRTYA